MHRTPQSFKILSIEYMIGIPRGVGVPRDMGVDYPVAIDKMFPKHF